MHANKEGYYCNHLCTFHYLLALLSNYISVHNIIGCLCTDMDYNITKDYTVICYI